MVSAYLLSQRCEGNDFLSLIKFTIHPWSSVMTGDIPMQLQAHTPISVFQLRAYYTEFAKGDFGMISG